MNKVFKLNYKSGPHGDECSTYEIKIFGKQTLQDFLNALDENEYGTVYIEVPNPETYNLPYASEKERYKDIKINYIKGKSVTFKSVYEDYLDKFIDNSYNNWANGGWGCMNYWIKLK